jgi:type I restriction enzyme S subunit
MKKINWTPEQEAEINRIQRTIGVTRKSAIRKMRAAAKVQAKGKAQAVKTTPKPQPQQKSAGVNRSVGKTARVSCNLRASIGSFCGIIRPKSPDEASFLSFFFRSASFRKHRNAIARGANIQNLRFSQFEEIELEIPSEQRQIAARLEGADRLRRTHRYTLELTDTFLPAAFLELFGEPVRNERGWPTDTLESVATKITDGEHLNPRFVPIGFPIVMAEQVDDWGVSLDSCKCVSEDDFNKFIRKCEPAKNDILIVSRGATIGRTCVVNTKNPFCMMGSVILIKPDSNVVNPYFLSALLKSASFLRVLRTTSGASAQQAIYIAHLKDKVVVVPPLQLQQKFAALVEQVELVRSVQRESLRQAEHLFASLLDRAFSV